MRNAGTKGARRENHLGGKALGRYVWGPSSTDARKKNEKNGPEGRGGGAQNWPDLASQASDFDENRCHRRGGAECCVPGSARLRQRALPFGSARREEPVASRSSLAPNKCCTTPLGLRASLSDPLVHPLPHSWPPDGPERGLLIVAVLERDGVDALVNHALRTSAWSRAGRGQNRDG